MSAFTLASVNVLPGHSPENASNPFQKHSRTCSSCSIALDIGAHFGLLTRFCIACQWKLGGLFAEKEEDIMLQLEEGGEELQEDQIDAVLERCEQLSLKLRQALQSQGTDRSRTAFSRCMHIEDFFQMADSMHKFLCILTACLSTCLRLASFVAVHDLPQQLMNVSRSCQRWIDHLACKHIPAF